METDLTANDNEASNNLVGSVLWTDNDCARQLKISPRTLARLHTQRKGPPRIRLGKRVLYSKESVLTWLKSLEEGHRGKGRR